MFYGLLDETVVEPHIIWQKEHTARAELVARARIIELPWIGIPVVEMPILDWQHLAVDAASSGRSDKTIIVSERGNSQFDQIEPVTVAKSPVEPIQGKSV